MTTYKSTNKHVIKVKQKACHQPHTRVNMNKQRTIKGVTKTSGANRVV